MHDDWMKINNNTNPAMTDEWKKEAQHVAKALPDAMTPWMANMRNILTDEAVKNSWISKKLCCLRS